MKVFKLFLVTLIFCSSPLFSKGTAGNKAEYESRYIIDQPSAGVLKRGHYSLYAQAYTNGGLMMELNASIFKNFHMGLSFSGSNIIGSGDVLFQKYPGVQLKYRIINETISLPAFTIGINTQGRGEYDSVDNRFSTLSPGIFLSSSKAFDWFMGIGVLHGGISYSIESTSKELPNLFLGAEQSIGSSLALLFEYNLNFDDDNERFIRNQNGLLNAAIRWSVVKNLTIELQVRDLLDSQRSYQKFTRFITLEYISNY